MGKPGLELAPYPRGNPKKGDNSDAYSDASGSDSHPKTPLAPQDPELAKVAAAWPELLPAIKAAILGLVNAGRV